MDSLVNQIADRPRGNITLMREFAPASQLFSQGQPARGVFVLHEGRVSLSTSLGNKPRPVDIGGPGSILGLAEAIAGKGYQTTATALADTRVHFISRRDLMSIFRSDANVRMHLVSILGSYLEKLYRAIRDLQTSRASRCDQAGSVLEFLHLHQGWWCASCISRSIHLRSARRVLALHRQLLRASSRYRRATHIGCQHCRKKGFCLRVLDDSRS